MTAPSQKPPLKVPPLLMGAALIFWGWQSDLFIWGGLMAVIVECSFVIRARWELSTADLNRVWDLCVLLGLGAALLAYTSEDRIHMALKFFQWLPIAFFPILIAQVYGSVERIPLTVFSWIARRRPDSSFARKSFNISALFFVGCLISASAGNNSSFWFYPVIVLLIAAGLFLARPKRIALPAWLLLLLGVALAGNVCHQTLHAAQPQMEGALVNWIIKFFRRQPDPREARTAIGQIGRVKLSGRIVLRLEPEPDSAAPPLLRDASYDAYSRGVWRAIAAEFATVFVDANDAASLLPPKQVSSAARIASYLDNGRGLLALPRGTFELQDFPAQLKTNRFGTSLAELGPGFLNLRVRYGPGATIDGPPRETDLTVPEEEKPALDQIANSLNLDGKNQRQKIQEVTRFFAEHFSYSLYITQRHIDPTGKKTALAQFLTQTRSGHCEYFATATVLLLRELGIPARYATGYAVEESAKRGNTYVVRNRHAHAWALVYRAGKGWEDLDTTPPSWDATESATASKWESLSDIWSAMTFQFAKWRWSKTSYAVYLRWALAVLILALASRIFLKKRRQRRIAAAGQAHAEPDWPGKDSEFYQMDQTLTAFGLGRRLNEPFGVWLRRVESTLPEAQKLQPIFDLHRRLRFDPRGLTAEERQNLKRAVEQWLIEFKNRGQTS